MIHSWKEDDYGIMPTKPGKTSVVAVIATRKALVQVLKTNAYEVVVIHNDCVTCWIGDLPLARAARRRNASLEREMWSSAHSSW